MSRSPRSARTLARSCCAPGQDEVLRRRGGQRPGEHSPAPSWNSRGRPPHSVRKGGPLPPLPAPAGALGHSSSSSSLVSLSASSGSGRLAGVPRATRCPGRASHDAPWGSDRCPDSGNRAAAVGVGAVESRGARNPDAAGSEFRPRASLTPAAGGSTANVNRGGTTGNRPNGSEPAPEAVPPDPSSTQAVFAQAVRTQIPGDAGSFASAEQESGPAAAADHPPRPELETGRLPSDVVATLLDRIERVEAAVMGLQEA